MTSFVNVFGGGSSGTPEIEETSWLALDTALAAAGNGSTGRLIGATTGDLIGVFKRVSGVTVLDSCGMDINGADGAGVEFREGIDYIIHTPGGGTATWQTAGASGGLLLAGDVRVSWPCAGQLETGPGWRATANGVHSVGTPSAGQHFCAGAYSPTATKEAEGGGIAYNSAGAFWVVACITGTVLGPVTVSLFNATNRKVDPPTAGAACGVSAYHNSSRTQGNLDGVWYKTDGVDGGGGSTPQVTTAQQGTVADLRPMISHSDGGGGGTVRLTSFALGSGP